MLMFTMLFCCILSVLIIIIKDIECSETNKEINKVCKFTKGHYTMEFLFKTALVIAGIIAAYKHLFSVIILVATLVLLLLIDNSIFLDFFERSDESFWNAKCAETVAFGLCFLFSCTLAFFIKRYRP
jgi:predicted membrane metal-binding protein